MGALFQFGERHFIECAGQESGKKTDTRATTCNPFERKFNNPFEGEKKTSPIILIYERSLCTLITTR